MDAFGHSSSLRSFAFLIVALVIIDRHNRIDGLILCNCSNPGQMFDVDPRSMVPLPSADLQDQLDSNFNVSSGDVTTLADSYSTNTITDSIINGNATISPPENATLILMDHLPENVTQQIHLMNVSSDLQLNDDIAFASFDALVGDLLNLTSNASEVISTSKSLSSSSTAMMIGETTTQDITDFILDDFTSKSTGMSASEDDLSFAAFDSINIQASNPSNVTDQSSPMTSSSDLMKSDNTTHPQSNITLVILSDELSDFNFDASNFSTSDKDNSEMSTVMSHTGKKKSSESSESSSAETSTLPDIANNITDSIMIDVLDSMNNTNTTISLMADDLSDSGESSDLAVTVTLSQRSTKLTRSSDATQAEATVALSAESSVESQENNDSSPQVSSVAPASSSSGDSAELALTRVSISATLTDIASSGEDNSSATTTTNSSNDSSDTTVVNQGPSSSATTEDVTTGSAVDSKSQENAEAGSTTNAKDSILDKSSKKSSESNENESREESESAEVSPSSPEPTAKSRKPPTSLVPAFDCQGKEEGPYANPHRKCSHYFYLCADDEYFVQFCPANMYYDKTRFLCDGFDNVFDCSGVRHTRPPAAAKITTPSPAIAFDCTERDDGDYEVLSCIEHFVTCFGGKAIPRVCSPGLLFDDNVKQCEFPKYIPKCGGHARTTPTTAAAPDDVPATTVTYNFNCERRQDGAHADPDTPCSRHFFMCSSGRTFFLKCPDNLFFNRNSTECDYRKAVVECKKPTKLLSTRKP